MFFEVVLIAAAFLQLVWQALQKISIWMKLAQKMGFNEKNSQEKMFMELLSILDLYDRYPWELTYLKNIFCPVFSSNLLVNFIQINEVLRVDTL